MKKSTRTLALLLAALSLLALLAGCGADAPAAAQTAAADMPAADAPMDVEAPAEAPPADTGENGWYDESYEFSAEEAPAAEPDAPAGGGETLTAADLSEKIIYSGDLSIETTNFDAAAAALDGLAGELGGFVESSEVSGSTRYEPDGSVRVVDRYASYVLRVPTAQFQACIHRAGNLGNVVSSGTSAENITSQFIDQEARQDALKLQEERLLAMLGETMDVDSLVALESRLSDIRYEIESIERTLRNWQTQVDYSTVRVWLQEVELYTPTVPIQRSYTQQLGDALRGGWNGFVRAVKSLSLWLLEALPVLVILAVIAAGALIVLRRRKKRRAAAKTAPEEKKGEETKTDL